MKIPLRSGLAFQKFTVQLGGSTVRFKLRWLTRFSIYAVDITADGETLVKGRALHPGQDLLDGVLTDLGSITLTGDQPTVSNLGRNNSLVYEP